MTNSDNRRPNKRAERQTALAGKRPYHRVPKILKQQRKLQAAQSINKENTTPKA